MERIPYKVTGVQTVLQAHGSQSQVLSMILRTKRKNTWSEDTEPVRAEGRCSGQVLCPRLGGVKRPKVNKVRKINGLAESIS